MCLWALEAKLRLTPDDHLDADTGCTLWHLCNIIGKFLVHMSALRNGLVKYYAALVVARVVFAFAGTGYIHPDEYFQNGEVTAG